MSKIQECKTSLLSSQILLSHLQVAQSRMKHQADKGRIEKQFQVGDLVLIRLQPYRQNTVVNRTSHKLSKRYFGPYSILQKIGSVAYRVGLPSTARIHDVFHVSKLKAYTGDPNCSPTLIPADFFPKEMDIPLPTIIDTQVTTDPPQYLVQLSGDSDEDAVWMTDVEYEALFGPIHLADKVFS